MKLQWSKPLNKWRNAYRSRHDQICERMSVCACARRYIIIFAKMSSSFAGQYNVGRVFLRTRCLVVDRLGARRLVMVALGYGRAQSRLVMVTGRALRKVRGLPQVEGVGASLEWTTRAD